MVATKTNNNAAKPSTKEKMMGEKRDKLLKNLGQECQVLIEKVKELFTRADRSGLEQRYELGTTIRDLRHELSKGKDNTYGLNLINKVCKLFGWERGTIYGSLAVVEAFPQEVITTLCDRPFPNGRLITFGHLRVLARVNRQATRGALLEKTLANGWTRVELEAEVIKHTKEKSGDDGRGRPMKIPTNLPGLIGQQEKLVKQLVDRSRQVWEKPGYTITERVKHLPETEVNGEQLQKLQHNAINLREAIARLQKQLDETEQAVVALQKKLDAKQSLESVGETDAVNTQAAVEEKDAAESKSSIEEKEATIPQPSVEAKGAAILQPSIEEKGATITPEPIAKKEKANPQLSIEDNEAGISQQAVEDQEAAKPTKGKVSAKESGKSKRRHVTAK